MVSFSKEVAKDLAIHGALIAIPFLNGQIAALNFKTYMTWRDKIKTSPYTPPRWVFAAAWSAIYLCVGHASYLGNIYFGSFHHK